MSNYDLTLTKEVTREFAWEVMASIFKLEVLIIQIYYWNN